MCYDPKPSKENAMPDLEGIEDDGLWTPVVKPHCERKYRLVGNYASIFSTSMKNKWDCRVYIDLFAGAGRARIEEDGKIVDGSPMLGLGVPDKFDLYILCDEDAQNIEALTKRVASRFPDAKVEFVHGDSNAAVDKIIQLMPTPNRDFTVLGFCVVDPFRMGNLKFDTIRRLSERYMDFLVLIPTYMDANRNETHYVKEDNHTVEDFLGLPGWRARWEEQKERGASFAKFMAQAFTDQMMTLAYMKPKEFDPVMVTIPQKNVPLYQLTLYSRSATGQGFWKEARKYSDPQIEMDFL